ncbi:MAG: O-antigen ligase family protein [Candidatus Scalindua sp.]
MIKLSIWPILIAAIWGFIFLRWQRGVYLLLIYLPFAGFVTLALYPSSMPKLYKDIFFVIPTYISGYMAYIVLKETTLARVPAIVVGFMISLAVMVFSQMFNPSVANWMVAAIGVKVWLFYLPLFFVVFVLIQDHDDLVKILRVMVMIAWIPCAIGIAQWIGSMTFGYRETMQAFYGPAAAGATQNFAKFYAGASIFRIPSTFSYVAQYFGYTLAMIVPAYSLMRMDPLPKWRWFSRITLSFVILASFLSGARTAYLFVPILLLLIYLIDRGPLGMMKAAAIIPLFMLTALYIAGIDPVALFQMMFRLTTRYSDEIAYRGLIDAIANAPLGLGTGMNTGPARFAFYDPRSFIAFENYYAKVVYELGIPGLLIVIGLFLTLIVLGYKAHRSLQNPGLRSCSAAILAFVITMALNSFKGWQIDLDPINVYFWVFTGILFKLEYVDQQLKKKTRD